MQQTETEQFRSWTEFYKTAPGKGTELLWPSETLARMMKGNYIPGIDKNYSGKTAIDVGFGSGNNLVFLGSLGLKLSGVEVSEEICVQGRRNLEKMGFSAELKAGSNRSIPFDDNSFDVLVSWNVVHYEDNEEDYRSALAEYNRVLRPGGRFFVSTVAPQNKIFLNAEKLSAHQFVIQREDDFRQGKVFFCFASGEDAENFYSSVFSAVKAGRIQDFLFTELLDWFLVTGTKR